jgi:hypothetical protein
MAITQPMMRCWLIDVAANSTMATADDCIAFDWLLEADKPSDGWFEFANNSAMADGLGTASGGPDGTGPLHVCHLYASFDGLAVDFRMIVESVESGLTVLARGRCIFAGYSDNAVDRLTLNQVTLASALYGKPGSIQAVPDSAAKGIRYAFAGKKLPAQKGLFQTIPGNASWTNLDGQNRMPVVVSPKIHELLVDGDSNANFIDRAASEFIGLTAGIPIDNNPLGSYAHFVADTSDATLNLTGQKQGIAVGFLGTGLVNGAPQFTPTSTFLTFARNPAATATAQARILEPAEGLKRVTNLARPAAKVTAIGGYTNHGLPDGAQIMDGLVINTDGDPIKWNTSLYVFVAQDSSGLGGAYFWPHNGTAYRIGQEIEGACSIAYDPNRGALYVAGKHGVFTRSSNVVSRDDWVRVGSLNAICREVRCEAGGAVSCWVEGSGPADGLYISPPLVGSPVRSGYDGWSALGTSGALLGYHYDAGAPGGGALTVVYQDNPTQYVHIDLVGSAAPTFGPSTDISTSGAHVAGMDDLGGLGAAIRTDAGADGLYLYGANGIVDLNADHSLVDRYDAPVGVNRVQLGNNLYVLTTDGVEQQPAALVCATDAGFYVSASQAGGGWMAMPKQSGIGDQSVSGVAISKPIALAGGRTTTRVYCITKAGLYIGHMAGIYFDAEGEDRLGIGAYFTALLDPSGKTFPDNDIAAICFGARAKPAAAITAAMGLGVSGRVITIAAPKLRPGQAATQQQLPSGVYWLRPLDERNKYTYRLHDPNSSSPTARMLPAEFTSIQSDSGTGSATAAGKLAQAIVRKWMDAAVVPHEITIPSILADVHNNLRRLRPSHQVAVSYDSTPQHYRVNLTGMKFYAISVHFSKARTDTQVHVDAALSTVFRSADPTDANIGDALSDAFSKQARTGKAH